MSSDLSTRFTSVARVLPASPSSGSTAFEQRLADLYHLSQRSSHIFGSPIGPFYHQSRSYSLPRFVYFGPHASDESLRLAFLAGFDHRDLRGAGGLLQLVERLALQPEMGQGLNLSVFPLVDVLGHERGASGRNLDASHWGHGAAPELALLDKDARLRGYHGFVTVGPVAGDDIPVVRLRGHPAAAALGVELISSEDFEPFSVRWEAEVGGRPLHDGPLSVADDLPFPPFELSIRLPASWSADLFAQATASVLIRFIQRYRGVHAYGHNL